MERELTIEDLLDQPIDLDALDEAIETFMEKLHKARLKEAYIFANLRNFYLEVADSDEAAEFIKTGRDISVDILEEWR